MLKRGHTILDFQTKQIFFQQVCKRKDSNLHIMAFSQYKPNKTLTRESAFR